MAKKENLMSMYYKVVKDVLKEKNVVDVDLTNADSLSDYVSFMHEAGWPGYSLPQLTQILMYNSMLQTDMWTPRGVEYYLVRK